MRITGDGGVAVELNPLRWQFPPDAGEPATRTARSVAGLHVSSGQLAGRRRSHGADP